MPTRCTEAATCSGIRNSGSLPTDTHAGKPDRPDRTSGLEPVSLSRPSRTAKSPKLECALFAPKMPFAFASSAPASTGFSGCKQTGPFVPSQFTFARVGARSCCGAHASAPPRGPCKSNTAPQGHFMKRLHGLPGPWLDGSRRLPASHSASVRSNLSDRAMPENQPRCGSTRTPAMRARNPRGLLRRSRWCRTDVRLDASLDRNRSSIPTDRYRADCRRARQSSRHEHRRSALPGAAATGYCRQILSAHIGGITPSLPKRTAPACKEPSD
jgi:hypothetical protein